MTAPPTRAEAIRLGAIITRRLGLHVDEAQLGALTDALRSRMDATRSPRASDYLGRLAEPDFLRDELRALAPRLSIPETYFIRDESQLRAFAEVALPERVRVRAASRELRVVSAGCATGEETYSLAMYVLEHCPDLSGWQLTLTGFDMNPAAIEKARGARYTDWSLRHVSDSLRARYFRVERGLHALDDSVRAMASFEVRNLLDDDPVFWRAGSMDVVFCRNVTMYLAPDAARAVIARIARALAPGGFLFLGHADSLRGVSSDFELRQSHETFFYQLRAGDGAAEAHSLDARPAAPQVAAGDRSWVDTIQGASDRIASLARGSSRSVAVSAPATEAEALLVRAVALTNQGEAREAEVLCRRLIDVDPAHPGARYLLARCREAAGDARGAAECDDAAVALDPGFAMPHLHLALLARKVGDLDTARVELERALALLSAESPARVELYGEGFGRESLVQFCRAQLRAVGGSRS